MITWDAYFDRLVDLRLQFDLARKALDGFEGSKEALAEYADKQLEDLRKIFQEAAEKGPGPDHSGSGPLAFLGDH